MSRHPITEQPVVLSLPGMNEIAVERDVPYKSTSPPGLDVYRPLRAASPLPAVVLVTGYADAGAVQFIGCKLKEMAAYDGWGRLLASRGLVAVTYDNDTPWEDAQAVIAHLREHAEALGIDPARIGVWSCSGNVPTALALLAADERLACAVLAYGYMLDAPGSSETADAAAQIGFAVPTPSLPADALAGTPLLVVRAGRDETPGLNVSLDAFVANALEANWALSIINHPEGPHAFDLAEPTERSRTVVMHMLDYLHAQLVEEAANAPP